MAQSAAADNSRPPQTAPARVTEVRLGVLMPVFGTKAAGYPRLPWSPLDSVYQAFREINNKSDGVADHLLPGTKLAFSLRDSKCDARAGLSGVLSLMRDGFGGLGVSAIVGADCSGPTLSAAQVAAVSNVPIVSGGATTPELSDGLTYPTFFRTIPTSAMEAQGLIDILAELFNYTHVALVSSTDACAQLLCTPVAATRRVCMLAGVLVCGPSARRVCTRHRQNVGCVGSRCESRFCACRWRRGCRRLRRELPCEQDRRAAHDALPSGAG